MLPVMGSKKLNAISIRFDEEQHRRLQEMKTASRLEPADLIRISVDGLYDYFQAHGGRIILPLDFTKFFTELKGLLDDDTAQPMPQPVLLKVADSGDATHPARKTPVSYRGKKS